MSNVIIRRFQEPDRNAVIAIWRDCGLVKPQNNPGKDIDRKKTVQSDGFLVGEENGRIVATCMAGYDGHRGWIYYLAVAPDCRRSGLGRQILAAAETYLRALGCPKINLQVRETNPSAIGFYRAVGFSADSVMSLGKRLVPDQPDH